MTRLARKAIITWQNWRSRRKMNAVPGVREARERFFEARRCHRPTIPHERAMRAAVTAALRNGGKSYG